MALGLVTLRFVTMASTLVILACLLANSVRATIDTPAHRLSANPTLTRFSTHTEFDIASDFFVNFKHYLSDLYYRPYREALMKVNPSLMEDKVDQLCFKLLNQTLWFPFGHLWSARLLDASGSLMTPGTLAGTLTSFGDFDSCLAIEAEHESHRIFGQYCFATLRLASEGHSHRPIEYLGWQMQRSNQSWPRDTLTRWLERDFRFPIARALCLPSACRAEFIKRVVLDAYEPLRTLRFNVGLCQSGKPNQVRQTWSLIHLAIWLMAGLVLILVAISSLVDILTTDTGTPSEGFMRNLACFSLVTNGRALFSVQRAFGSLAWLDGLRVILTVVVLLSHVSVNHPSLQLSAISPFAHFPDDYLRQSQTLTNRYLVNSTFTIKSYFLISGFLLTLSYFKKQHLPSFVNYFLHRWLRFTPSLLGYIAFTLVLSNVGSGPLFHKHLIEPYVKPCLDNLPYHLLYINNWLDFRHMCGFQTWYLSVDLQLYLLAYPILWLVSRRMFRSAYFISALFIAISYLIILVIFAAKIQGIPFFISVLYPQLPIANRGYLYYWTATYNHLEAYFVGVLLGILVGKKVIFKLSLNVIHILLYVSFFTMLCLPFTYPWFLKEESTRSLLDLVDSYSWFDGVVMTSAHAMWIVALAWIFYAASTYQVSNLVLKILSAPILAPLARISFCVYLVHVPLTWFNVHQARHPETRNEFGATQFTQMTLLNSILAAIFLHLFFEAPFTRLTAIWFSSKPCHEYKAKKCHQTDTEL